MDCGLVVLWVGSISVRGNKGDIRGNARISVSCNPIDTVNNAMIDLYSTWKIRIEGVNGINGINGEPGTIWSHVGNLLCPLNREPMGCEFSE